MNSNDAIERKDEMEIGKLGEALAKAQGEMNNAPLNKINPHFKSRYADLAAIRDATIPALSKNGLSMVQYTRIMDGTLVLFTRLLHSSGEFLESEYPLPMMVDKPQVMGSAYTYAKRYSWSAILGISADDDDDANAAQDESKNKKPGSGVRSAAVTEGSKVEWLGPMNKTALGNFAKEIVAELRRCTDMDQMVSYWTTGNVPAALKQMKVDMPDHYESVMNEKEKMKIELTDVAERHAIEQENAA